MDAELKRALSLKIETSWYNHGKKSKDFIGTYKEWFIKNQISVIHRRKRLNISGHYGSMKFKINLSEHFVENFNLIIKLVLSYLGDKAILIDGYNREYKINWR